MRFRLRCACIATCLIAALFTHSNAVVTISAAPQTFKVAFYNIQSGSGEPGLPGAPILFTKNNNCTDPALPLNGWGVGFVQNELVAQIKNDPAIVAIGLAEAWTCARPAAVQQLLGWAANTGDRNGLSVVARYGFAGAARWLQVDTSRTTNPADTKWVLQVPVCLDGACSQSIQLFAAHWGGLTAVPADLYGVINGQANQTLAFMAQLPEGQPRILIGDLNAWEDTKVTCTQGPIGAPIRTLRAAGYVDGWRSLYGNDEGNTAIWNRPGCANPAGYLWKRIDYGWSKYLAPVGVRRFGMVVAGQPAPSDHAGLIVEYPSPASLLGTIPPTATVTAPYENAPVAGSISVVASATDDLGISRVECLVDGVTMAVDTSAPYEFTWDTRLVGNGAHVLTVAATDHSGNRTLSSPRAVSVENPSFAGDEIVMHAVEGRVTGSEWTLVADGAAASGYRLQNADSGAASAAAVSSNPASYVEFTFSASAGKPYRLWVRGRALGDSPANDSVFAQFDGAVSATNSPAYRIGTTAAATVNIEQCDGCGLSGWGFRDNGFPLDVIGTSIYFTTTGTQRLRIQAREDGLRIDQVVLSAVKYRWTAPGRVKDDTTLLAASSGVIAPPPPPPPAALPSPWTQQDVGAVGLAGDASVSGDVWTVRGAGADVWGTADQFHFVYRSLSGDGEIVARLASLQNVSEWSKAGVMMRESGATGSAHGFMFVTPAGTKGLAFQRRPAEGGLSVHTSGGSGTPPAWVKLSRAGNVVTAFRSADGVTWTLVDRETIAMITTIQVGLAVSSHSSSALATATFDHVTVTAGAAPPPMTLTQVDIGAVGLAGSGSVASDVWTIRGSGADIWGTADQFHFAYQSLTGNGEVVARVAALQNVSEWTKAGVMMRDTVAAGSAHALMLITPAGTKGMAFQRRTVTGGLSAHTWGSAGVPPAWLKLTRVGSTVSAYWSADGVGWTLVGSDTIALGATIQVGLAVSSHDNLALATATFDRVRITATGP